MLSNCSDVTASYVPLLRMLSTRSDVATTAVALLSMAWRIAIGEAHLGSLVCSHVQRPKRVCSLTALVHIANEVILTALPSTL